MKVEGAQSFAAGRDVVWSVLNDPEQMAQCGLSASSERRPSSDAAATHAGSAQCRITSKVRASRARSSFSSAIRVLPGRVRPAFSSTIRAASTLAGDTKPSPLRKSAMAVSPMVGGAWLCRIGVSNPARNWHKWCAADV